MGLPTDILLLLLLLLLCNITFANDANTASSGLIFFVLSVKWSYYLNIIYIYDVQKNLFWHLFLCLTYSLI